MGARNWLDIFEGKGINCRDAFFLIIVSVIFINMLREYLAIDNLGIFDNSVEKGRLQFGLPEIV